MTNARNTGIYGRVNPGPGFGDEYSYTDDVVLTAAQDGAVINNAGAAKAITVTLPAAIAGMEFPIDRVEAFSITVTPDGTDTITTGNPGGSYVINSDVLTVFYCRADGAWRIAVGGNKADYINVRDYGAIGNGVDDDSAAFQLAFDTAETLDMVVFIPPGDYLINTTLIYKVPIFGYGFGINAECQTRLHPGMTDGSPVIYGENVEGWVIENIAIIGRERTSGNGYTGVDCVGIRMGGYNWVPADGVVADIDASRGYMRNTTVWGCKTGYEMLGWIPKFDNIYAQHCDTGFKGRFLNAGNIDLVIERCGVGFELSDCEVLTVQRILDEGPGQYRTGPSRIDASNDVVILTYYTEGDAMTYPWLVIGGREPDSYATTVIPIVMKGTVPSSEYLVGLTGLTAGDTYWSRATQIMHQWNGSAWVALGYGGCRNVQIISGMVGSVTGSAPIVVDYSNRHSINVLSHDSDSTGPAYQETANARADMSLVQRANVGPPGTTIATGGLSKVAYYLNPNPGMGGKRFGCDTSATIRATVTQEATISRSGSPGVRVTADAGAGGNNLYRLYFRDAWVARIAARGTGFTVGAWVWIPDTAGMGSGDSGTIYYPALTASTIDGSANADTQVATTYRRRGAWNFLHLYQVPQTDATELRVSLVANLTTNEAPGDSSVYIVVDEMYIAEGDCWERMAAGQVQRSNECTGHIDGGIMTIRLPASRATTMIANATQSFMQGDTIEYTDTAASGNKGITCTTPGAGGTAVFKAFGVIAA